MIRVPARVPFLSVDSKLWRKVISHLTERTIFPNAAFYADDNCMLYVILLKASTGLFVAMTNIFRVASHGSSGDGSR